jgi:hypothetical protein
LLDDIQDIEQDMIKDVHSSVYCSLSDDMKRLWSQQTEETKDKANEYSNAIWEFVLEKGIIDRIKVRICDELESAVAIAGCFNMAGLKNEFYSLLQPLKNTQNPL